jgi:hypothetical protein
MGGLPVPFLEERHGVIGGLDVELLEGEAHAVCPPGLEVHGGEAVQLDALALRQVGRVLEPEIAAPLQFVAAFLFAAANRVDGFVDELDDVEFVESDLGVGQAFRGMIGTLTRRLDVVVDDPPESSARQRPLASLAPWP